VKVGDLIQDEEYCEIAVILAEKVESYTVYYMTGIPKGDMVEETKSKVQRHFRVISEGRKFSYP
jgi:hypothetical protein